MSIPWSSEEFLHFLLAAVRTLGSIEPESARCSGVLCYYSLMLLSTTLARAMEAVESRTNKGITSFSSGGCVRKGRVQFFMVCVAEPRFLNEVEPS